MLIVCPYCHSSFQVDESSAENPCTCPECGQQIRQTAPLSFSLSAEETVSAEEDELPRIRAPKKVQHYESPTIAVLLSLLFPGFGQFYLQSYGTGCLFQIVICFLCCFAVCSGSPLSAILAFAVWIFSVVKAYLRAVDHLPADMREPP